MKKKLITFITALVMCLSLTTIVSVFATDKPVETPNVKIVDNQSFNITEVGSAWQNTGATFNAGAKSGLAFTDGAGGMIMSNTKIKGAMTIEYQIKLNGFNHVLGIGLMPDNINSNPYSSGVILLESNNISAPWGGVTTKTTRPYNEAWWGINHYFNATVKLEISEAGDVTIITSSNDPDYPDANATPASELQNITEVTYEKLYAKEVVAGGYVALYLHEKPTAPITVSGIKVYQGKNVLFDDKFDSNNIGEKGKQIWKPNDIFNASVAAGTTSVPTNYGATFVDGNNLINKTAFVTKNVGKAMDFSFEFNVSDFKSGSFDAVIGMDTLADMASAGTLSFTDTAVSYSLAGQEKQSATITSILGKMTSINVVCTKDGDLTVSINGVKVADFTGAKLDGFFGFSSNKADAVLYSADMLQCGFVLYSPVIDVTKVPTKVYNNVEVNLAPIVTDEHDGTVAPTIEILNSKNEKVGNVASFTFTKADKYTINYSATNSVGKTTTSAVQVLVCEKETQGSAAVNFNQGYFNAEQFVASTGVSVANNELNFNSAAEGSFFATNGVAGRFILMADITKIGEESGYLALTFGRSTISDKISSGYMIRFSDSNSVTLTNLTMGESNQTVYDIGFNLFAKVKAGKTVTIKLEITGSNGTLGVRASDEAIEKLNVSVMNFTGVEFSGLCGISGGTKANFSVDNVNFVSKGSIFDGNSDNSEIPNDKPLPPTPTPDGGDKEKGCGGCTGDNAAAALALLPLLAFASVKLIKRK